MEMLGGVLIAAGFLERLVILNDGAVVVRSEEGGWLGGCGGGRGGGAPRL